MTRLEQFTKVMDKLVAVQKLIETLLSDRTDKMSSYTINTANATLSLNGCKDSDLEYLYAVSLGKLKLAKKFNHIDNIDNNKKDIEHIEEVYSNRVALINAYNLRDKLDIAISLFPKEVRTAYTENLQITKLDKYLAETDLLA